MKLTIALLMLTIVAPAQDMTDRVRYFNGRPVTLQPVFTWWSNAAAVVKSNTQLSKAKQRPLPKRIMPAWVRITTSQITNTGGAWISRADIQESPGGVVTNQIIRLEHGPATELARFQSSVIEYDNATRAREHARQTSEYERSRADSLYSSATYYSSIAQVAPSLGFQVDAANYSRAARQATRSANDAYARMDNLDRRRSQLSTITQGRVVMTIDTFALRTGRAYAGIPIYDLGLSHVR